MDAREPQRAEAWFYLAGSYAPLVQWRVLRGERLAAARDGKKIKDALERALQLDPTLNDAYFGIGLYHYYADVAPAAAKILRWLLFLPGGDRVQGMREMLRAREHGELLTGEADYQLHPAVPLVRAETRRGARAARAASTRATPPTRSFCNASPRWRTRTFTITRRRGAVAGAGRSHARRPRVGCA